MTQGIGADRGGVNLSMALANRGSARWPSTSDSERGHAVLDELLESADVFLTNLRPGALERLGLDAETVAERYPALVYARGHGYGVRGPDADHAGYDASAFWARGGVAHILSPPDRDHPIGQRGAMGDRNGAMALAFGIAAALLKRTVPVGLGRRRVTVRHRHVDVVVRPPGGPRGQSPSRQRARRVPQPVGRRLRTKDGRHIQLVFLQADRYWSRFCADRT